MLRRTPAHACAADQMKLQAELAKRIFSYLCVVIFGSVIIRVDAGECGWVCIRAGPKTPHRERSRGGSGEREKATPMGKEKNHRGALGEKVISQVLELIQIERFLHSQNKKHRQGRNVHMLHPKSGFLLNILHKFPLCQ